MNYVGFQILKMSNILDQIFADKKVELSTTRRNSPLSEIKHRVRDQPPAKDVYKVLEKGGTTRIIAEIKPRTPFKGELRKGFDAKAIAIFDKIGVNFSEVYGKFSKKFKNKIPGTKKSAKLY